jgi:hypothetical protein
MCRTRVRSCLALLAALLVSAAGFGRGSTDPPGRPGEGGRVIAGPGPMPALPGGGFGAVVIVSDKTVGPPAIPFATMYVDVPDWGAAVRHLTSPPPWARPDGSVTALVVTGHGSAEGGVATKNSHTHLSDSNLSADHAAAIQAKLRPDAPVVLLGCHGGTDNLCPLARKLNRRVIANTGAVWISPAVRGAGDWVEFRP